MSLTTTTFSELVAAMETAALAVDAIKSFKYGQTYGIVENPQNQYPLFYLSNNQAPDSVMALSDIIRGQYHSLENITIDIADLYKLNDDTTLEDKYTQLTTHLTEFLTAMFTRLTLNRFALSSDISVTRMPFADNDQTCKIRAKFQVKIYLGDRF